VYNGFEGLSQISEKFNIWCLQGCWIIVFYVYLVLEKKFVKKISISCLMVEFERIENLGDLLTQYEILGFCRLDLNPLKFYWTKTWNIMTENQISANSRYIEIIKVLAILQI